LDFRQHRTDLRARQPRATCAEHGVVASGFAAARAGGRSTLMMERLILLLAQQMSVSAAARLLHSIDQRLGRVLDYHVTATHRGKNWSKLRRVMVDETTARRGRRYVTNVIDAESTHLMMAGAGKVSYPLLRE
jgi:transposase